MTEVTWSRKFDIISISEISLFPVHQEKLTAAGKQFLSVEFTQDFDCDRTRDGHVRVADLHGYEMDIAQIAKALEPIGFGIFSAFRNDVDSAIERYCNTWEACIDAEQEEAILHDADQFDRLYYEAS